MANGQPILLLHAFPLDARMWEAQVSFLESAGYEVIAPNLPGREPDNDLGSWAARLLELLPGAFIPIGCSMGGYLIFELWRRAKERIPAVAPLDTRATADTAEIREGRQDTICVLSEDGFDPFWEAQKTKLFGPAPSDGVIGRARAIAAEQPITNLVATLQALVARPDSRETLEGMDVPALVVVGEHDQLTPPADAEAIAAAMPRASIAMIGDAGHLTPLEKPTEVNEELFLFLSQSMPLDTDAVS